MKNTTMIITNNNSDELKVHNDLHIANVIRSRTPLKLRGEYVRENVENKTLLEKYKDSIFNRKTVIDPITGKKLHRYEKPAKKIYRKKYTEHVANIDHVIPAEKIYEQYKHNQFLSDEDFKIIANLQDNYAIRNSHYNKSKQSLTDSEYIKKHPDMPEFQKVALLNDEKRAKKAVEGKARELTAKGMLKSAGTTAVYSISSGVVIYGTENIRKYKDGDITALEAIEVTTIQLAKKASTDVTKDLCVTAVKSQAAKSINKSKNQLLKKAATNGLVGAGIDLAADFVVETSKSFYKLLTTDMSTEEFYCEVSRNSTELAFSAVGGYIGNWLGGLAGTALAGPGLGTAIGATLGNFIGSYIGYLIGAAFCNTIGKLYHHQEIIDLGKHYAQLRDQLHQRRIEFEESAARLLEEKTASVQHGFDKLHKALVEFDYDGMDGALELILTEFGQQLRFKSQEEFDNFMMSDEPFWI